MMGSAIDSRNKQVEIADITQHKGDCLKVMPTLPDNSVDMVLADLPYGCLNKGNKHAKWDKEIDLTALWPELLRVCKDNAAIVFFGQGRYSAKLIMSQPHLFRYDLIWQKGGRCSGFLNAKKQPLREHEQILVFYRKQPTYNPQMTECEPHQRNHSRGKQENTPTNRCYGQFGKAEDIITNLKYPKSILSIARDFKDFHHPTQKPVALLEYLVKTYTDEGDTVLDCAMGSGSTMVACANTGRKGIGIELSDEYYNIAIKRVKATITQKELF